MQKFIAHTAVLLVFLVPVSALAQSSEADPPAESAIFVPYSAVYFTPTSTSASSSTATIRPVPTTQPQTETETEPEEPPVEPTAPVPDAVASSTPTSTSASLSTSTPRSVPDIQPQSIKAEPEVVAARTVSFGPSAGIENGPEERNIIVASVLATLASVFLFFGIRTQKKRTKDTKNDTGCLNIKKRMEEKFNELTDLKDRLTDMAKDETQERITNMTADTKAGKLLATLEEGEKAYEKLKGLYEECKMSLDRKKYQGLIITESLANKRVLKKVKILETKISQTPERNKTPWAVQWTQNTFEIPEQDAEKVAKQLSADLKREHVWYVGFKNEEYHFIVYKGKIFKVDLKNPTVYKEARQYGISLGIPEHQLDFPVKDEVVGEK